MDGETMTQRQIDIPALPLVHTAFAVSTVVLCVVVWSLRATSYFGDALEAQYWAACAFAAMAFGVGTLMVEMFRGDIIGASLGRVLVGLSLLIMAAKAHEFMEQAQECLLVQATAKPVEYMPTTYVREVSRNGWTVSYESSREPINGRYRAVLNTVGQSRPRLDGRDSVHGSGDPLRLDSNRPHQATRSGIGSGW